MSVLRSLEAARSALAEGRVAPGELLDRAAERNAELDSGTSPVRAFLSTIRGGAETESPPEDLGTGGPGSMARADGSGGGRSDVGDSDPRLSGVPVAVKDNLCTETLPTTCGSRILEGYHSPYASTAVRRLTGAGAVLFGKTNLDEFAMGSSTENSAFGPTRNPVDGERVPGGSSGGSAAAVAGGVVPVALGSDTGGSVRQPAAFCGVVGLKPTYGRVSRYGLVAFASSLDQVGVLAGSVRDAGVTLEVISGHDPRDATSGDRPAPRWSSSLQVELGDQVIGLPREYTGQGLHPHVRAGLEEARRALEEGGATVREVSLPTTGSALPCYYVIAPAEASSNLARYDGVRYGLRAEGEGLGEMYRRTRGQGFGSEVKRRIMLGTYVLSEGYYEAYYLRARRLQGAIARDFRRVFRQEGVSALLTPTTPSPPFRLGARTTDPYRMYRSDVFTVSANLAGIPAMALPVGQAGGLPVSVQLMCPAWHEERLLGIARRLEERLAYRHPLAAGGGE